MLNARIKFNKFEYNSLRPQSSHHMQSYSDYTQRQNARFLLTHNLYKLHQQTIPVFNLIHNMDFNIIHFFVLTHNDKAFDLTLAWFTFGFENYAQHVTSITYISTHTFFCYLT